MTKRFKIFLRTVDGKWETWISWVSGGAYPTEATAIRQARQLAKSYATDDITAVKELEAIGVASPPKGSSK